MVCDGNRRRQSGDIHHRHRDPPDRRSVRGRNRRTIAETLAAGGIETACHDGGRLRSTRRPPTIRERETGPGCSGHKVAIEGASGARRRELMIAFVRREAMKTLGITDTIDAARPLDELGLDFADVGDAREPARTGPWYQDIDRETHLGPQHRANRGRHPDGADGGR